MEMRQTINNNFSSRIVMFNLMNLLRYYKFQKPKRDGNKLSIHGLGLSLYCGEIVSRYGMTSSFSYSNGDRTFTFYNNKKKWMQA
jgi:hypothetical protein